MTSLHPMLTVGRQLTEHVRLHLGLDRARRRAARARAARRGAHPRPASGAARVPAPVLGRHAAADRDRDRARLPAEAADRRRADDRARRHRAGRDPAAARPPAPRERPRGDPDHPRPRRDVGDRRPRLDLLRGPGRRVGHAARTCSSGRATRTRARCSTRCRIPRPRSDQPLVAIAGAPPTPGRDPAAVARSTRAARTPRDSCRDRRAPSSSTSAAGCSPAPSTRSARMSALELTRRRRRLRAPRRRPRAGGRRREPHRRAPGRSSGSSASRAAASRRSPAPRSGSCRPTGGHRRLRGPRGRRRSAAARRPRELARLQLVFQNPYSSLNPRRKVGAQIADALDTLDLVPAADGRPRAELLELVGLPGDARPTASRTSSRAASASGSRSRARSPPTRR